jgi:hypothetical protein
MDDEAIIHDGLRVRSTHPTEAVIGGRRVVETGSVIFVLEGQKQEAIAK